MRLITDDTPGVSKWVKDHLPEMRVGFGPCVALGIADGDTPIAGFVFHEYHAWPDGEGTMQMSLASDNPKWIFERRKWARTILLYPFYTAKVWKLWTAISHTNERALKLGLSFGFTREAMLVDQLGRKKHAMISRMLRKDYDRLYGANNVQKGHASSTDAS